MKDFLDSCAKSYFEGVPQITDGEWDFLARINNYDNVGYMPTDGHYHLFPMYSLQKCFDLAEAPVSAGLSICLLYTSPSPRDKRQSRMPSSA